MRFKKFKSVVNKICYPEKNIITKMIFRLNWVWWQNRNYNANEYKKFQKEYWETIGLQRWADKDHYDYSSFENIIRNFVNPTDKTLIDLGCGGGQNLAFINKSFPWIKTFGIDASTAMCEIAKKNSPASEIYCGFYGNDAPKCSLNSFDVITARSTITYVDETDIINVLSWIFSKSDRLVIISEPSGLIDNMKSKNIIRISQNVYKRKHDHTHIRDYSHYIEKLSVPFTCKNKLIDIDKKGITYVFEKKHTHE